MQLEIGKRYILRSGKVTGPLEANRISGCWYFPFTAQVDDLIMTWRADGGWNSSFGATTDDRDIVEEYTELEPVLSWVPGRTYLMRNGGQAIVTDVQAAGSYPVVGYMLYTGMDAVRMEWTIEGKRFFNDVTSSFDLVGHTYTVVEDLE